MEMQLVCTDPVILSRSLYERLLARTEAAERGWDRARPLLEEVGDIFAVYLRVQQEFWLPLIMAVGKDAPELLGELASMRDCIQAALTAATEERPFMHELGEFHSLLLHQVRRHERGVFLAIKKRFSPDRLERIGRRIANRMAELEGSEPGLELRHAA